MPTDRRSDSPDLELPAPAQSHRPIIPHAFPSSFPQDQTSTTRIAGERRAQGTEQSLTW